MDKGSISRRALAAALLALSGLCLPAGPAGALTMKPGVAWPDRTIRVCWENPRREHRQERTLVRKAVRSTWERESAVRFTGWRRCRPGDRGIRVSVENTYPRTAGRGVEIDGAEAGVILPSLWSLAALSVNLKAPVHEFGHVLGFGHEYARRDLPAHLAATCGGHDKTGTAYFEDDTALTPFDVDSIMVGCRPRATREFSTGIPELSPIDILGLVRTYGSHPDNILDADETGDRFGAALLADDFDGDGIADLAVGAPGEDGGRGAVYVYRGTERRGLRPWRRVPGGDVLSDPVGFGEQLARQPGEGTPRAFVVLAGLRATAVTLTEVGHHSRRLASAPALAPPGTASGPLPSGVPGFPDLSTIDPAAVVEVDVDLDGDGVAERILGIPEADGGAPGSGAVVILRGSAAHGHAPWYWFGQRH